MALRKLTLDECEISLEIEEEDIPIEGSFASGDEEADRRLVQDIKRRLYQGDLWAWCCVVVKVTWKGYSGVDTLGGCSYANEKDFRQSGGYFNDMVDRALDDLNETLARAHASLAELVESERKGE